MKILLTGAFGNVGLSTLNELIERGHEVRILEIRNRKNLKLAIKYQDEIEIIWGDLRNLNDVEKAVKDREIIIHLGAIIPPLADEKPELAEAVNVGGTANILTVMKNQDKKPKLLFTSSISVYGDRRENPYIKTTDPLIPSEGDNYALTKVICESLIRESGLEFTIFRLTYIVSVNKLNMDPLMFHMPLDTCIEICDTKDVGLAITNALDAEEVWGKTFNIAGGENCRLTYEQYLTDMLEIFGLGRKHLPKQAFAKKDFHCGFINDSAASEKILHYQRHTLEDYYNEVKKKVGIKRFFASMVRGIIKFDILKRSDHYRRFRFFKRKSGVFTVSENKFIRKTMLEYNQHIEQLENKIKKLEKKIKKLESSKDKKNSIEMVL